MKSINVQLFLLRVILGAFLLSIGIQKIQRGWLTSDQELRTSLTQYQEQATGFQKTYLEEVALPHSSLWSKLIAAGETAIGGALLLGLLARFSAFMGFIMILNLHAANGNLYGYAIFGSPSAALLLVCLVIVFLSRSGRWLGLDYYLSKSKPKSFLW